MTVTGVVDSVGPQWQGSSLTANVAAGAVVLPVKNAGDFEDFTDGPPPQPRILTIGEDLTPRKYIDSQQDDDYPQTLTLAEPLGAGFETGLPVYMWDPTSTAPDKRSVQFRALVVLDDQPDGDPIRASIDLEKVPLAEAYALEGARVSLVQDDDDEWWVARIRGRSPQVDSGVIVTPQALGLLNVDGPWPTGSFQTIKDFGAYNLAGVDYNSLTGIFTFLEPGIFSAILNVTFSANMAGDRIARVRVHYGDGTSDIGAITKAVPVETASALQIEERRMFRPGMGVSMEARQTSGGDLMLLGSNGNLGNRLTAVDIVRVAM